MILRTRISTLCLGLACAFAPIAVSAQTMTEEQYRQLQEQERQRQAGLNSGVSQGQDAYRQALQDGDNAVMKLPPVKAANQAFTESQLKAVPFSEEQIRKVIKMLEDAREASRPKFNAVPRTGSVTLDMQPGSPPPSVRVATYHGGSFSFVDATGEPWPIQTLTNFNTKGFSIDTPYAGSNTINVSNLGSYDTGNVAVYLEGLPTPVLIGIYGNQKETDYRMDFRLLLRKPGSSDPVPASGITKAAAFDKRLNQFVDGIPPEGGEKLESSSPFIDAYRLGDKIALRTQLTVLSAFDEKIPSSNGTSVYLLPITPAITVSQDGKQYLVTLKI
jgi:intracellular multiplication protein IcmK